MYACQDETTSLLNPGEGTNSQPVIGTLVQSLTLDHDPEGAWSTHTKPPHTRVNSHHFWSTHPIYEIKKDYSEGGLWYKYI